ncbi:hypothetical protein NBRC116593_28130 [Sulfitobacter pacificus]
MDCPLQHEVRNIRTDGSSGGIGCLWTGGRCFPSVECDERRRLNDQEQGDYYDSILPQTQPRKEPQ